MALLDRIAEILRERHAIGEIVRVAKTNASVPVSDDDAELLAKRCACRHHMGRLHRVRGARLGGLDPQRP